MEINDEVFIKVLKLRTFNYKKVKDSWVLDLQEIVDYINVLLSNHTYTPDLPESSLKELKMSLESTLKDKKYLKRLRMK